MALTTHVYDNVLVQIEQKAKQYRDLINRVAGGEHMMEESLPWSERGFQQMVAAALRNGKKFERDSQKLQVIKEVFGGKS